MKLQTDNLLHDLERWHKSYMEHIESLSYSKNSITLYDRVVRLFIEDMLDFEDLQLQNIKALHITRFLKNTETRARKSKKIPSASSLSKSTKETYLKTLKNFFSFISDNNNELFSFDRILKSIKIAGDSKLEEKLIYLTEDEIHRLLVVLDKEKNQAKSKSQYNANRNSLLIKLLLFSGLRISEALAVKPKHFLTGQSENMLTLDIVGKGEKKQFSYIKKDVIQEELNYFIEEADVDQDSLIMTAKGNKQWNRSNAFTVVNNIYKKAMIHKTGLHMLRHTLAMRLTKNHVELTTIKKILRHRNISTTTIYARATEENVTQALEEF